MNTRVLVTGGAGYIGSILVPALLDRGFGVHVVDNFMYGQNSLAAVRDHPRFALTRGDVRAMDTMRPLLKDADVIIPLAGIVGAPQCDRDPETATSTNLRAIVDMLDHVDRDQRVLLPVTNSGYGIGEPGKYCTEETPMRPVSLYGRDKVAVESALLDRHPAAISFRLATVFGGRWRGGAEVVHTVRTRRHGEPMLKTWATRLAYRIIQAGSDIELAIDAGDFKLLFRNAVDHLLRLRESDPYPRGLVVWLSFTQAFVPYERAARQDGRTHFPFFSRNPWKTFASGLTSFSFLPIYACLMLAGIGLIASLLLLVAGPVLVALLTFFWATTMGAIGSVGIYIARTYKDVRGRPSYIVESAIGFPDREVMKS